MITTVVTPVFAFLPNLGPMEMLIVGAIAVLLFGKRLPDVGRSLGKSFMEFKRGMSGVESEIRRHTNVDLDAPVANSAPRYESSADREEPSAPKFTPPPAEAPTESTASAGQ